MNSQTSGTLSGKKVIILGGSAGIGFATAKLVAAEGAEVSIVSSNKRRVDQALKELPGNAKGYAVDLGKENNIRDFFSGTGTFDHLVYTAGENIQLIYLKDIEMSKARDFFNLRYWGAYTAIKYGASHINAGGSVNLIGGIASPRPGAGWSLAGSICAAMEGLTRAMAVELAPVRVNLVAPGVVKTNLWDSMPEEQRNQFYQSVSNSIPLKRVGEAEDIAQAFSYLMKQGFCTGQVLVVDGGTVLV